MFHGFTVWRCVVAHNEPDVSLCTWGNGPNPMTRERVGRNRRFPTRAGEASFVKREAETAMSTSVCVSAKYERCVTRYAVQPI